MPKNQHLVDIRDQVSQAIFAGNHSGEDDVEEIIVTDGARSVSSRAIQYHEDSVNDNVTDGDGSHTEQPLESATPKRHVGFPPPEELPRWFPENIKDIYLVDRHGGSLSFKELHAITRYRGLVEIIRRRKWKQYLKAGEARWKLQKVLRRLKSSPKTKAFYEYRKKQYDLWKDKALRTWKELEKIHRGVLILDETININFRQERMIYDKKLRSSM